MATADEAARYDWWIQQLGRIQSALADAEPETVEFGRLLVNAGICESKLKDLRPKVSFADKPAVASRPKTKLDRKGPPKL